MKRLVLTIICLLLPLSLVAGCHKTAAGNDGLIRIARKEIPVADADTIDIKIVGFVDKGQSSLICLMTGGESQGHDYFAIEFRRLDRDRFEFISTYPMAQRGTDIRTLLWGNMYVLMVNNTACRHIQMISGDGKTKLTEVGALPFLYGTEPVFPLEYEFLDADGNQLN